MLISDWSSDVCSSDLLVGAGVVQLVALEIDFGAVLATRALAQLGGEPLSEIERAWPPDVVLGVVVVVGLKARILARGVVGALDLEDQGHQRLGRLEERRVGTECGRRCRSRWGRCN